MNEPFLLSNLIELQELDNEIFKLISEKSQGTTVKELKSHEIEFKKLQSDKQNIENELQLYFDAKNHIEKSISESQLKIDTINEKLNTNLDASELQNYNLQKQNFEKNLLDYEKSLNELNEENELLNICISKIVNYHLVIEYIKIRHEKNHLIYMYDYESNY